MPVYLPLPDRFFRYIRRLLYITFCFPPVVEGKAIPNFLPEFELTSDLEGEGVLLSPPLSLDALSKRDSLEAPITPCSLGVGDASSK